MPAHKRKPVIADITSVGGAAFDVFVRAPHTIASGAAGEKVIQFPLGAKVKVESVAQSCGGGAANTSVGFSRLGLTARFCGVVGDDEWGRGIQEALQREGVLTDAAVIIEDEISSFSIVLVDSASGERTILYSPNVNAHLSGPVFAKDLLLQSRWLFVNHLADVSSAILDDCLELIRKPDGLRFAWNPGGSQIREGCDAPLTRDLLRETDILFLNAEEAMLFFRQDPERLGRNAAIRGALRAGARAGVRVTCVTDGANGASVTDGTMLHACPVLPTTVVVDATGAGDAFAVGVTSAILLGEDLPTALKAGMLNAASVVSKIGTQAGLLTETEIRSRLASTGLSVRSSSLE